MAPIGRPQKSWQPPPGYIAIQTYISVELHETLLHMAEKNERSLRAEARILLTKGIQEWKQANKPNPPK